MKESCTGYYIDASGIYNGYLWNNGQFTTIDVPFAGATGTDVTAINDQGDLVGGTPTPTESCTVSRRSASPSPVRSS